MSPAGAQPYDSFRPGELWYDTDGDAVVDDDVYLSADLAVQRDLVDGIYRLLMSDYSDPVNIGNPDEISMLDLAKEVLDVLGSSTIEYQGQSYDFGSRFARMTVRESILQFNPQLQPAQLEDLAETAAVITNLDLVISVDTGVLHLAAALGKPTWGLIPAYAANLAGALVSGMSPLTAVLFALAGALEILIFWGAMVCPLMFL